ncbi:MAG: hypothetical protein RLP44_00710 [Aggregatilineales bacterium]
MLKRCLLIAFILLTLMSGITLAQEGEPSDGLSAEERGYLNRLAQAADRFENYTSYSNESQVIDNELTQLIIADQTVETQETRSLEAISTVTRGENPYGNALVNAYIDQYDNGAYSGYAITGELRYVDATLYINISYDPTYAELSAELPVLPQGWIAIADVDTFIAENPHLAVLDLDGFVEQFVPSDEGVSRLHLASDLSGFASAVTLEQSEIDGTPVDVITMFFGWSGLSEILEMEDPDFDIESNIAQLFAAQLEESEDLFSLLVALSPEDDVVGIATGYRVDLVDVEMNTISPDVAPGTLFNLVLDNFEVNNISAIGEIFPAVEIPQTSG